MSIVVFQLIGIKILMKIYQYNENQIFPSSNCVLVSQSGLDYF